MKDDIEESIDIMENEIHELTDFHPVEIVDIYHSNSSLDETVKASVDKLADKYNFDKPVTNTSDIIDIIDKVSANDKRTFDLMASKVVSETHSRARFKAAMASNALLDKLSDLIYNVDQSDYQADPMSFLMLMEKFQGYIEKSDELSKMYQDPAVDESLKAASIMQNEGSKDDRLTMSERADITAEILAKIRQEKS